MIVVNSKEIRTALKMFGGLIGKNNSIPALDMIRLTSSLKNKELNIYGTNLEVSLKISVETSIYDDFDALIDYKMFNSIISKIDEQSLELDFDKEKEVMAINTINGNFNIHSQEYNITDYVSEINTGEEEGTMSININSFINNLSNCKHFVSDDQLRIVMTGVNIKTVNGNIVYAGTNGHILRRIETEDKVSGDVNTTVPGNVISILDKLNNEYYANDNSVIKRYAKFTSITNDKYNIIYRGVEGKYPNIDSVIPDISDHYYLKFDLESLKKSIEKLSILSGTGRLIIFDIKQFGASIYAEDLDYSCSGTIGLTTLERSTSELKIGFNANFLLDMLKSLTGDIIGMYIKEPNKSAVFYVDNNTNDTLLVMPLTINK